MFPDIWGRNWAGGIYSMVTENGRVDGYHYYTKYTGGGKGRDSKLLRIYIFLAVFWFKY
jgi:hypothetical protein